MRKYIFLTLSLVTLFCGNVLAAQIEILPNSYSFDKATDTGSYSYHDWTEDQLIDGNYGIAPWSADLGNGHAYEWVGWINDTPVNIDFDFGTSTQIDTIKIGSVQDHLADVVLPSINIFSSADNSSWSLVDLLFVPESTTNNNSYRTFQFDNLGINDQYVRVSLLHSLDGPWTFVDEVDFFQEQGNNSIPEPTTVSLLGIGLVGLVGAEVRRRRKKAIDKS